MTKRPILFVTSGIVALFIAMGVGRFAYTPILPLMQDKEGFSSAFSGYLASSNYAGYMIGAILAGVLPLKDHRSVLLRLSISLSIATTALMGLTHSPAVWMVVRLLSGLASAFVFVLASSIVLDALAAQGKSKWSGFFYGGVGAGIFSTGLCVPDFGHRFGWQGAWLGLSFISVILFILPWICLQDEHAITSRATGNIMSAKSQAPRWIPWLIAAYGCEGLGYIVTGTFMVTIADKIPGIQGSATQVWTLVGLAAIPSCLLWAILAKRIGYVRSLILSMVLQAIGIAIPVIWISPVGAAISALLFGSTFMGITTLATTFARQIAPQNSSRMIGTLTAIYGLGQVIGPSVAGVLASVTDSYNTALLCAAGVVLLGASLLTTGLHLEKQANSQFSLQKNG